MMTTWLAQQIEHLPGGLTAEQYKGQADLSPFRKKLCSSTKHCNNLPHTVSAYMVQQFITRSCMQFGQKFNVAAVLVHLRCECALY